MSETQDPGREAMNKEMREQTLQIIEEMTGPEYYIDESDHLSRDAKEKNPHDLGYKGISKEEVERRQKNKLTGNWFAGMTNALFVLVKTSNHLPLAEQNHLKSLVQNEINSYYQHQLTHNGLNSVAGIHRMEALAKEIIEKTTPR